MNSPTHCLECGAELRATDLRGLCPKCLLKLGLASQLISGGIPATAPGIIAEGVIAEPFDFGNYRILRLLGKGGMGAVYEAEHRETGRRVALKVLGQTIDSADMRQRFIREGQLAASVRHPNVVAVFGAEEVEGAPVIAMEMVTDGTLKDRVKRKGPLRSGEAVDLVLQMIDGLEAAHAAGVLHRDIKPANTFVAADGTVKVGDFGLSISTLAKAETQLTQSGAVLGTPAFASPEQLRGIEVDTRSDIYAVGATLYYLLTGKPTHDAEALVTLIAAVLEKTPEEPRVLREDVPGGLSRVVMRCLAKQPDARFSSYTALREALLPFSSTAPTPATLGLRFLAGVLDVCVMSVLPLTAMFVLGERPVDMLLIQRSAQSLLVFCAFHVVELAYFALPEGLWGASFGKALCGLRVVGRDGLAPGLARGFARAFLLACAEIFGAVGAAFTFGPVEYDRLLSTGEMLWSDWLVIGMWLAMFTTMRRSNGYAAVHDLLTGTRVVSRRTGIARPAVPEVVAHETAGGLERIGPYVVVAREGNLVRANDPTLRRHVWIRASAPDAPLPGANRREMSRPGRLRWLAGKRTPEESWDAYEAPEGAPLTRFFDQAQPWARLRFWLLDLAEELYAGAGDGTLPDEAGADHVWVTRDGRALLLDFPAPAAVPTPQWQLADPNQAQSFLTSIVASAANPLMPQHARELVEGLTARRFDAVAMVAGTLRSLIQKPAVLSRRRRLFTVALPVLLALAIAAVGMLIFRQVNREFDQRWAREYPGKPSLRQALALYAMHDVSYADRVHVITHLAGHHRAAISNAAFWEWPETIAAIDAISAELAKNAVSQSGEVSPAELARADAKILPKIAEYARWEHWSALGMPPFLFALFLGAMLAFGALWTPFVRAPLALWLAGAVVVTGDGRPAGRGRLIVRMLSVLAPAAVIAALVLTIDRSDREVLFISALALAMVVLLVGAVWSVLRPSRSLPDAIAGTFLVPR